MGSTLREGLSDMARAALSDIGDSYQQVLMQHASVSPADGLTGDMVQVNEPVEVVQSMEAALRQGRAMDEAAAQPLPQNAPQPDKAPERAGPDYNLDDVF